MAPVLRYFGFGWDKLEAEKFEVFQVPVAVDSPGSQVLRDQTFMSGFCSRISSDQPKSDIPYFMPFRTAFLSLRVTAQQGGDLIKISGGPALRYQVVRTGPALPLTGPAVTL